MSKLNKKGSDRVWFMVISLIIVVVVSVKTFGVVSDRAGNEEQFFLSFYTADVALLIESIQSVPGDIEILYPIEGDYRISLKSQELSEVSFIEVQQGEFGASAEIAFHTLPGITIEESTGEGLLRIIKADNIITFETSLGEDECSDPIPTDVSVKIVALQPPEDAPLSQSDLELVRNTFEVLIKQKGIEISDTPTLSIHLDSQVGDEKIVLKRPESSGTQEVNYNFIACDFTNKVDVPVEVEIQDGEITLVFSVENKVDFLRERADYAESFAQVLEAIHNE